MTAAQVKTFFRTVIKVVAGGPAVGTPGSNRAAGLLAALDKLVDFVAEQAGGGGAGTVTSVDGIDPDPATGDVELPASDAYPGLDKRAQVAGLFTSGTQTTAADMQLSGDPRTDYLFASFYDFATGYWYFCFPNPTQPDGSGNATAWWVRR